MTHGPLAFTLIGLLAAALVVAAATDIRSRIISNKLTAGIALAAPLFWWASGLDPWPGMAMQAALGSAVFALFAGLFALGMMGGGDVKLLGALALWLPLGAMAETLFFMAIGGGVLTLLMMASHRLRRAGGAIEVPYGVAISGAALWVINARYLNQFV